jgi:geranylgeranyl diphosphate synthase, type I
MVPEKKLTERAMEILQEKGREAVELARHFVLQEPIGYGPLKEAISYFVRDWNDVLHPALVSLSCEAVGGEYRITIKVGAALVLLAGGADIHDDVIDESLVKAPRQTVFGKFGRDLAILTGDALLLKGIYLLHEACEEHDVRKKTMILEIVKRAFFEISGAEAAETVMRGRIDVPKQDYLEVIRRKVGAGEASTRLGAILGGGTPEEVETMAEYGRTYGVLMLLRDEFVDMFEQDELGNRVEKEVLPLPIMVALTNKSLKPRLLGLLHEKITEEKIENIVDIVTDSAESKQLVSDMKQMVNQITLKTRNLRYCRDTLELLAHATLEDL